ncbi:response regulator transcription factor [Sciscionella sediminilitoris]|uniref:response regulator transcription factor n=1 Tax=Sciscionella sediminilitoris TaxID=1445613 RepID=UPI0004DECBFF|nr:response regulator transcription factor [Sciscionella sp. SE31]
MRVLVVDDEAAVRESIARGLRFDGYEVAVAANGLAALDSMHANRPDVVVLDVMMPVLDGLETCRRLRANGSRTPVLMLTAKRAVNDRVSGLDAGADDYLVKPFDWDELLARLRALLRRRDAANQHTLRYGELVMDLSTGIVTRGQRTIELTKTEAGLLAALLRAGGKVVTRSALYIEVWGYDFGNRSNSLDVYIGYLRRKLEAGGEQRIVETIRGVGYLLKGTAP